MAESEMDVLAAAAAQQTAVEKARASGQQIALFDLPEPPADPKPGDPTPDDESGRTSGRPKGAKNKANEALRDILIARGYSDPASRLAHMAGLNTSEDPRLVALGYAEAIIDAASPDALSIERAEHYLEIAATDKERATAWANLMAAQQEARRRRAQLPDLTVRIMKVMESAAGSLMPYIFGKITPDQVANVAQMVVQMAPPGSGVQGGSGPVGPPPMPTPESQSNQSLSEHASGQSDGSESDA